MTTHRPISKRAIGYVRCSTAEQRESGLGIEAQRHAITEYARRHELELSATLADEGISGAAPLDDRPGLLAAIASLRRGDVLIVAKIDRLSRASALEHGIIEELIRRRGGRVVSAAGEGTESDDPAASLMRDISSALARHERSVIAARTKAALRAKIARGEAAGTARYGQHPDQAIAANEAIALNLIHECREAGYSLPEIARELNAKGHTTRAGSPWRWEYVRSLLRTQSGTRRARGRARATTAAVAMLTTQGR